MTYLKGDKYTKQDMIHNLHEFMKCATDKQFNDGVKWYSVAAGAGVELSQEYDVSIETAIGVIAALSPNNVWDSNIKDANTVLRAAKNGNCSDEIKVRTYGSNKEKAMRIACGENPLDVLGGEKVVSFYTNILAAYNGALDQEVTVDMWALRAACGVFDARKVAISDTVYETARQAYQDLANEYNLAAKQLQAVVWVAIRDLTSGIRKELTHNHALFCPNCFGSHNYIVHESV